MKKNEALLYIFIWTLSLLSFFTIVALYQPSFYYNIYKYFLILQERFWLASLYSFLAILTFLLCLFLTVYLIFFRRRDMAEINNSEMGRIDLSMRAIENIALNSARIAQVGIKSAFANAHLNKDKRLTIILECSLYSDVEVPNQMKRIQDRIKKDIEKYTSLPVASIKINIKDIETIGAKVER